MPPGAPLALNLHPSVYTLRIVVATPPKIASHAVVFRGLVLPPTSPLKRLRGRLPLARSICTAIEAIFQIVFKPERGNRTTTKV